MIKRILVALDPDQDTLVATRYAEELAHRHHAAVSGLAVVDTKGIAKEVGPGGAVGAMYYAEKLREQITTESRQTAVALVDAFESELESRQVPHDELVREGVPARRIVEDMKYHDILVIGRTPHFLYSRPSKKTHTLAQIVKNGIAPTLVVPDEYREVRRVLIAYDGSPAAARTLQRFAQLQPFGVDLDVEIVHVRAWVGEVSEHDSQLLLRLAASYLKAHGFQRIRESSLEMDAPDRRVLEYAESADVDLIVVGAHSVTAIKRVAFGSTTHALLKRCRLPFFLYH